MSQLVHASACIGFVLFVGCDSFPLLGKGEEPQFDSESDCTDFTDTVCQFDDVYLVDACGEIVDLVEDCNSQRQHCVEDAKGATCVCQRMWTGEQCGDCIVPSLS